MLVDCESALVGNFDLAAFDFGVEKLFHSPALDAHQMIVMSTLI